MSETAVAKVYGAYVSNASLFDFPFVKVRELVGEVDAEGNATIRQMGGKEATKRILFTLTAEQKEAFDAQVEAKEGEIQGALAGAQEAYAEAVRVAREAAMQARDKVVGAAMDSMFAESPQVLAAIKEARAAAEAEKEAYKATIKAQGESGEDDPDLN